MTKTQKKEKQRKQSKGEKECEWQKDDIKSCDLILKQRKLKVTFKVDSFKTKLL